MKDVLFLNPLMWHRFKHVVKIIMIQYIQITLLLLKSQACKKIVVEANLLPSVLEDAITITEM